ncbi:MAG TPA: hypothetical protein ENI79_01600 [Rhodospirillales bacterium]|nr:hypothetical protein [Rhodospirillales bacterium]
MRVTESNIRNPNKIGDANSPQASTFEKQQAIGARIPFGAKGALARAPQTETQAHLRAKPP